MGLIEVLSIDDDVAHKNIKYATCLKDMLSFYIALMIPVPLYWHIIVQMSSITGIDSDIIIIFTHLVVSLISCLLLLNYHNVFKRYNIGVTFLSAVFVLINFLVYVAHLLFNLFIL